MKSESDQLLEEIVFMYYMKGEKELALSVNKAMYYLEGLGTRASDASEKFVVTDELAEKRGEEPPSA